MENQNSVTYAEAGVDIVEGARAVDAIKDTCLLYTSRCV